MVNFTKNKVLVVGSSTSNVYLGTVLARSHPEIDFDVLCAEEFQSTVPNLHIKSYPINISFPVTSSTVLSKDNIGKSKVDGLNDDLLEIMKNAENDYDFMIASGVDFQKWEPLNDIRHNFNIPFFCPNEEVSNLEESKLFTKELLLDCGIPTPDYKIIDKDRIIEDLDNLSFPIVFKMDKLFSHMGFGSWVFRDHEYKQILSSLLGLASESQRYYVEDFVKGKEVSVHFLCNGVSTTYIGAARDYKKIQDGDRGINTAGMGCYSPVEYFTDDIKNVVCNYADILVSHLNSLGIFYHGFLYIGIMIDDDGIPQVLELNTRVGNPEFMAILNTINTSNLLENMLAATNGDELIPFTQTSNACSVVCIRHAIYNNVMKCNSAVPTIDNIPEDIEYIQNSLWLSKFNIRGFVLSIADTRQTASDNIYRYLSTKNLRDFTVRTDIGYLE